MEANAISKPRAVRRSSHSKSRRTVSDPSLKPAFSSSGKAIAPLLVTRLDDWQARPTTFWKCGMREGQARGPERVEPLRYQYGDWPTDIRRRWRDRRVRAGANA